MEKGLSNILLQYHSDRREEGGRGLGLSMSNALQVVTEALSSSTKLPPFRQIEIKAIDKNVVKTTSNDVHATLDNNDVYDDDDDDNDDNNDEDDEETGDASQHPVVVTLHQHLQPQIGPHPSLMGKTIVASDNDVTNGFVKDGKMLPYVFEANESGVRKRSSKILPVCGVCGKRFVCVTTMKRHLVTHTGEKPFSCKVCGKQYTQKGNLRVHERTHRNDRPFECNICHQKFYRKEPMQKHQWRQHGVVHFKTRPSPVGPANNNNNNAVEPTPAQSTSAGNDNVIYTPLVVDQIKYQQEKPTAEMANNCYVRPMSEMVTPAASRSPLPPVAHLLSAPVTITVNSEPQAVARSLPANEIMYRVPDMQSSRIIRQPMLLQSALTLQKSPSFPSIAPATSLVSEAAEKSPEPAVASSSPKPIKLKMKFAYQKEQEDKRDEEAIEENFDDEFESIPENLGDLKIHSSGSSPADSPDSRPPTIADPFQCIGCCVVFAHKPALKEHQTCNDDKERPFQCCKCGYKFRQKAHLQKHQWRIHRRRYCDQDEVAPATTITMQDIINHGVEKSLREIPVYHGKTSSRYYSEVLGLEYSGVDDNSSSSNSSNSSADVQPLDLSPVKKNPDIAKPMTVVAVRIRQLEDNPLLNQPPLPRSPARLHHEIESAAGQPVIQTPPSTSSSSSVSETFPAWKKQRTELLVAAAAAAPTTTMTSTTTSTHRALPPISILQKPSVLSPISRKQEALNLTSYKHSSWIRESSGSIPTDLSAAKKSVNPESIRDQLSRIQNGNVRTV